MAIGIQESDVWVAADSLLKAGEQPTIERVRLHLGRGSPNTVGPHLKTWFRGLSGRLDFPGQGNELPEPVAMAVKQLWEAALNAAHTEWSASLEKERNALTKAQDEARAELEALEQERARLRTREADLEEGMRAAHAQAAAAEERLQIMEAQLRDSIQATAALRKKLEESQLNERDALQAAQAARVSHEAALASAEERHATHERRWLGDLDAQRQMLKKAQLELDQQRKAASQEATAQAERYAALQSERDTLGRGAADAQAMVQRLSSELDAARSAAATAQNSMQQRNDDLLRRSDELFAQMATKDQQIELLVHALGMSRRQNEEAAAEKQAEADSKASKDADAGQA